MNVTERVSLLHTFSDRGVWSGCLRCPRLSVARTRDISGGVIYLQLVSSGGAYIPLQQMCLHRRALCPPASAGGTLRQFVVYRHLELDWNQLRKGEEY